MNQNGQNPARDEIRKLKEENALLKKDIEKKNKYIEELKNNYKIGVEKLIDERQALEKVINGDTTMLEQLNKEGIIGEFLKPKENLIKIDPKTNEIIGNQKIIEEKNFTDFYDVIVNIKSIKDINKGWEIKMSKRAEEKYDLLKKDEIIKIGVIGNSNKGKSFLLSKISKIKLPSGTSIRTEGLSIKYPEIETFKNRKIALLDSAGLETPVLKEKEEFENNEKRSEIFREKSRAKIITELFLQNYIIYNSDILILVVGILTYSEQKLLNRIKTDIQRAQIKKSLFIIHNLITYTTIEQVKKYIDEYLLKSATFDLVQGHNINTDTKMETGIYYYEKDTKQNIYHLIFANEGSEAGNFYNNRTLKFLENSYQNVINLKPFDVIETIKDRFISASKDIMEGQTKISKDDFDNTNNKLIKLNQ